MKSPIFIIGNPRSGTTLLRVILNAHPDLMITPECGFAVWLYPNYSNKDLTSSIIIDQFVSDLFLTRKFETWNLDKQGLRNFIGKGSLSNYGDLVDRVYKYYGLKHKINFKRWGDKNNFYLSHIGEIKEMFPNAQFIHIVRDGRDVACSYNELNAKEIKSKYKPNLPTDIKVISKEWVANNKMIDLALSKVASKQKITVKHEDVVTDFKNTLKNITSFLGLNYESEIEDFHLSKEALEPEEFLQWKSKLYHKLDQSSVERYKKDLTRHQIEQFNTIAKETLVRYGYSF